MRQRRRSTACAALIGFANEPAIAIERIKPGHPQQNRRHERMHLTLKKEATKPPAKKLPPAASEVDRFIECYNQERPHHALNMKIWLVTFMHYDLGFFDHETGRVECASNPFEAQVLPMSPE